MSEVGRGRDGREEAVSGRELLGLSQDMKEDFRDGGMINHQMNPVKEKEALGEG